MLANQETIVELIGFVQRAFPELTTQKQPTLSGLLQQRFAEADKQEEEVAEEVAASVCHTELTFDFHRLNVLLLRGVVKDDVVIGKKIATATMSEAKIHATVGKLKLSSRYFPRNFKFMSQQQLVQVNFDLTLNGNLIPTQVCLVV